MSIKKPIGAGLLVVAAALLAMALMAPLASATKITTAGHAFTASLKPETTARFDPENAYSVKSIRCKESATSGTLPTEVAPTAGTNNNTNRTSIGTESQGPGGVNFDISNPTFTKCALFVSGIEEPKTTVTATTNSTNGIWTLSVDAITTTALPAAIGVPKDGANIVLAGACTIVVSSERATAVMGRWTNGTNSTTAPSTLKVDSQLRFRESPAACGGFTATNPAQFEATYNVKDTTNTALPVKVEE